MEIVLWTVVAATHRRPFLVSGQHDDERFALIVDDCDDAIRFFVDVLAFELVFRGPRRSTTRAGAASHRRHRLATCR
jgi:hypothetical protein